MYKVSGKRARRIIRGFVFDIDIEEKFEWRIENNNFEMYVLLYRC